MKWWQRLLRPTPPGFVLFLLCLMCLITYVDRVNIATAASEIRRELSLTATQYGLIFSVFGYPYLAFQVFGGGWAIDSDRARTLFTCGLVWAGATILTGLASGMASLLFYACSARCR